MAFQPSVWALGAAAVALAVGSLFGVQYDGSSKSRMGADLPGCGGEPMVDVSHPFMPAAPMAAEPSHDLPGLPASGAVAPMPTKPLPRLGAPPAPAPDTCIADASSLRLGPLSGRIARIEIFGPGTTSLPSEYTLVQDVPATASTWPYRFNTASHAEMVGSCLRVEAWIWAFDEPRGLLLEGALRVERGELVYRAVERHRTGTERWHAFRVTREAGTPGWVFREAYDTAAFLGEPQLIGFVLTPSGDDPIAFDPSIGTCDPNAPAVRPGQWRTVPSWVDVRVSPVSGTSFDLRLEPFAGSPIATHDIWLSGGTYFRAEGGCVTLALEIVVDGQVRQAALQGQLVLDESQRLVYRAAMHAGDDVSDMPTFDLSQDTAPRSPFRFERRDPDVSTSSDLTVRGFGVAPGN